MKRTLLSLFLAGMMGTAVAATSTDINTSQIAQVTTSYQVKPTDYTTLKEPIALAPVTEFFSFRCVFCYLYNEKLNIADHIIKDALNGEGNLAYNNVDFMIMDGSDITKFYIASTLIGKDFHQKFMKELYQGFHERQDIKESEDILKIFEKLGVSKAQIAETLLNPEIEEIFKSESEKAKKLNIKTTPTFVINGKYVLDMKSIVEGIDEPKEKEQMDLKLQEVRDRINTVIKHLLAKDS